MSEPTNSEAADELAHSLSASAGLATPVSQVRLAGGRNNRVHLINHDDGTRTVLKRYHHDPADTRDRLAAEWTYLTTLWPLDLKNTPQPLARDKDAHAALYTFIDGRKPHHEEIDEALVDQAANFIVATNASAVSPDMRIASEACFSIGEHIASVDRRVGRLANIDPGAPLADEAQHLAESKITPAWTRIREVIVACDEDPNAAVTSQILSPSDFGFHNSLIDGAYRATFIDFEYAGRDDAAKLICDFFCQPEIPVSFVHYPRFRDRILGAINATDADRARCDGLLDAYRIKWLCIMMNEFLSTGARRREFAEDTAREDRAARQLATITKALSALPV